MRIGCEIWAVEKPDRRTLEAFEMWRKMLGIKWEGKVANKQAFEIMKRRRIFWNAISRQYRLVGNCMRHSELDDR